MRGNPCRHSIVTRATPIQPNNSLINGLSCLQIIATRDEPVGVRELARELNLTPTRVSRLLSTLAHLGLVSRTARRKYKSGPAIHVLAAHSMHASPLLGLALPHLMRFREQGFTIALGVLWHRQVCYLFHERPAQRLEESLARHRVHPAEQSSAGMALLADIQAPPPHTIPTEVEYIEAPGRWNAILANIHKKGYAALRYSNGEISIGVPIGAPAVAALAISREDIGREFIPQFAGRLQNAARSIFQSLSED